MKGSFTRALTQVKGDMKESCPSNTAETVGICATVRSHPVGSFSEVGRGEKVWIREDSVRGVSDSDKSRNGAVFL